jgi:hypothetical protein
VSRWINGTKDPAWGALFDAMQRSAYRLEGQQIYSNDKEDAALERFRAGEPFKPLEPWPALERRRREAVEGKTLTRVRVVIEPPTDYTRMELCAYRYLAEAGEDIRIIAVPEGEWPAGLPRYDYWLIDEHDVWRMHYHENYRFRGAELIEGEAAIAQHLKWRDIALAQAVPLNGYLAARQSE